MIAHARLTGSLVRKDPVETVHPLVRVHPVTGEKCLFINGEFITKIQGLKEPEFRVMQDFLMQHLITGHDFQARVRWQPRTIVMFDNRSTIRKFVPKECPDLSSLMPENRFCDCGLHRRGVRCKTAPYLSTMCFGRATNSGKSPENLDSVDEGTTENTHLRLLYFCFMTMLRTFIRRFRILASGFTACFSHQFSVPCTLFASFDLRGQN